MSYAADVTPQEAWQALTDDPRSVLIDVRTDAEWAYVGVPDLGPIDKQVALVQWQRYPDGALNTSFIDQVRGQGIDPDAPVYFICRSGARSTAAAAIASAEGFAAAYNVLGGFEGDLDADGHRGVGGWKAAGLPWRQG